MPSTLLAQADALIEKGIHGSARTRRTGWTGGSDLTVSSSNECLTPSRLPLSGQLLPANA